MLWTYSSPDLYRLLTIGLSLGRYWLRLEPDAFAIWFEANLILLLPSVMCRTVAAAVSDTGAMASQLPPSRYLLRARDLADAYFAESLTVASLAREAGLSKAHFSREFRRIFGEPPHRYLVTRRLERAAALLRTTDWTVGRIAVSVGWESIGSFTSSFGRMFGMSPTCYRDSHPPASRMALVPACIVHAHSRPRNRTFREDGATSTQ